MDPNMSTPTPMPEAPKKNNNMPLIIGGVVVVLLCCCCLAAGLGYYLYQNGDQIFNTGVQLLQGFVI